MVSVLRLICFEHISRGHTSRGTITLSSPNTTVHVRNHDVLEAFVTKEGGDIRMVVKISDKRMQAIAKALKEMLKLLLNCKLSLVGFPTRFL